MKSFFVLLFFLSLSSFVLKGETIDKDNFYGITAGPNFQYFSDLPKLSGFGASLSTPALYSLLQVKLYYVNKKQSAYYVSMTNTYPYIGMNQYISNLDLYLNLQCGFSNSIKYHQAYNAGVSKLIILSNKSRIELSFDMFIHHGKSGGEMFAGDIPYNRGVKGGINYSYTLSNGFAISGNIGLAYSQAKYRIYDGETKYISYSAFKNFDYGDEPVSFKWHNFISIPLNLTVSYTF